MASESSMAPVVSVVIPTFDRAPLVGGAIESALRADSVAEVVVVDDGSTDVTEEVVRGYPEVRYIRLEHRGIPARARNRGLDMVSSDLVVFLDSDDRLVPAGPTRLARDLTASDAVLAYGEAHFFEEGSQAIIGDALAALPASSGPVIGDILRVNFLWPSMVMARTADVRAVRGFDEDPALVGVEDYDLWLRLIGDRSIIRCNGAVAAICRHAGGLSRDQMAMRRGLLRVLHKFAAQSPDLVGRHRAAWQEGLARSHAAIVRAAAQGGEWSIVREEVPLALRHAGALGVALLPAAAGWLRRRYVRRRFWG